MSIWRAGSNTNANCNTNANAKALDTGIRSGIRYRELVSHGIPGAEEEEEGVTAKVKTKNKKYKKFFGVCFLFPVIYF